jgi:small subunit ribosomal protein S7
MSRRNRPEPREVLPDARYGNILVSHLINKIMLSGKKSTAEGIVYGAIEVLEGRTKKPGIEALEQAIRNATPLIEVRPRRVGGATYQVPMEIREDRRLALALRWLIQTRASGPARAWSTSSPVSCSTRTTTRATRLRSAKTRTRWPKPTAPSRITAGK